MSMGTAVALLRGGIIELLLVAGPVLIVSVVVGLAIAIVQATTSIQEQTLTFVPKIAAMLGILVLLGPWIVSSIVEYTRRLFETISTI